MKFNFYRGLLASLVLVLLFTSCTGGKAEKTKPATVRSTSTPAQAGGESTPLSPAQGAETTPAAPGAESTPSDPAAQATPDAGILLPPGGGTPQSVDAGGGDEGEDGPPTPTPLPPKSPDTLSVAYTDVDGNLWLWTRSAGSKQLTTSGSVMDLKMSDDGALIAFTRAPDFTDYSLWVIDASGQNERQVLSTEELDSLVRDPAGFTEYPDLLEEVAGGSIYAFRWLPGTHTLAFVTAPITDSAESILSDNLWLVDADKGTRTQLLAPGKGGMFFYSPDGAQIAVVTPTSVSIVNSDGSNRRNAVLTYPLIYTDTEWSYIPTARWSIDSSQIIVAIPPEDPYEDPEAKTDIYRIDAKTGAATKIFSVTTTALVPPVVSPDLSKIAYIKDVGDPDEGVGELHIAAPDGSNDRLYETSQMTFASWSPDSTHFIFSLEGDAFLQYASASGSYVPLTDADYPENIRWVDNNLVLYIYQNDDLWEIRLGEVGKGSTILATLEGDPSLFIPMLDFAN